jgi:hypothetical protein
VCVCVCVCGGIALSAANYIQAARTITRLEAGLNRVEQLLLTQEETAESLAEVLETGLVPGTTVNTGQGHQLSEVASLDVSCLPVLAHDPFHLCLPNRARVDGDSQMDDARLAGDIVHQGALELAQIGMQASDAEIYLFLLPQAIVVRVLCAQCSVHWLTVVRARAFVCWGRGRVRVEARSPQWAQIASSHPWRWSLAGPPAYRI